MLKKGAKKKLTLKIGSDVFELKKKEDSQLEQRTFMVNKEKTNVLTSMGIDINQIVRDIIDSLYESTKDAAKKTST